MTNDLDLDHEAALMRFVADNPTFAPLCIIILHTHKCIEDVKHDLIRRSKQVEELKVWIRWGVATAVVAIVGILGLYYQAAAIAQDIKVHP